MPIKPLASALILAMSGIAMTNASAAVIPIPRVPLEAGYQRIADQEMTVSIGSGFANLRQKPSINSKILTKLGQGVKVTVIDRIAGSKWVHVMVFDIEGYVERTLLK